GCEEDDIEDPIDEAPQGRELGWFHLKCTLMVSALTNTRKGGACPVCRRGGSTRHDAGIRGFDRADGQSAGAREPDLLRPGRGLTWGDRRLPVRARTDRSDPSAVPGHACAVAACEAADARDRSTAASRTCDRVAAGQTPRSAGLCDEDAQ